MTELSTEGIVSGDRVSAEKMYLARELRRRMTPEEQMLWKHLCGHRLQGLHFRRQQVVDGFVVDFYCCTARLVVEVDGEVHKAQAEYDAERDRVLSQRGLRVLRIPNEDVTHDINAILARISALAAQAASPALHSPAATRETDESADQT